MRNDYIQLALQFNVQICETQIGKGKWKTGKFVKYRSYKGEKGTFGFSVTDIKFICSVSIISFQPKNWIWLSHKQLTIWTFYQKRKVHFYNQHRENRWHHRQCIFITDEEFSKPCTERRNRTCFVRTTYYYQNILNIMVRLWLSHQTD